MKKVELLNKYLSNLAVLLIKLHNLHWNVVGQQFMSIHNFTESQYDTYFVYYDDVAEALKMQGQRPLVKMKDYLAVASIQEAEDKDFSPCEVLSIIKADMEEMNQLAKEIRAIASEEDDFAVANMMEDHISATVKQLWFIDSMTKVDCKL